MRCTGPHKASAFVKGLGRKEYRRKGYPIYSLHSKITSTSRVALKYLFEPAKGSGELSVQSYR
jgi:hypothetical protein